MISAELSNKITITNVICTLMIVLLHSSYSWISYAPQNNVISLQLAVMSYIELLMSAAVPLFFAISSYLFYIDKAKTYKEKILRRVKTVLLPLFIYNIVAYGYYFFSKKMGLFPNKYIPEPNDFYNLLYYIINSQGVPPLWYLRELFIFVLFAPLIGRICSIFKVRSLFIVPVAVIMNMLLDINYSSFLYWLPSTILSYWLAEYGGEYYNRIQTYFAVGGLLFNCKQLMMIKCLIVFLYFVFAYIVFYYNDEKGFGGYLWRFYSAIRAC